MTEPPAPDRRSEVTDASIPEATAEKSTPGFRQLSSSRYWLMLTLIVLFGAAVRSYSFGWYYGFDDTRWVMAAQSFGTPDSRQLRPVYYERIVWNALLWSWGQLFGLELETTAFLMFLLSAATTITLASAARSYFGDATGLTTAFVYTTHPINVVYDVMTLPDSLAVLLLAAQLLLLSKMCQRLSTIHAALFGALVGLAFCTKMYYVLAGIGIVIVLLCSKERWTRRRSVGVAGACGVALGVAFGSGLHLFDSGNPWPYVESASDYREITTSFESNDDRSPTRRAIIQIARRFTYFRWLSVDCGLFSGIVFSVGAAGLLITSLTDVRYRTLAGIVLVFLLFLLFMPLSFAPLVFVDMSPRYSTVLLVPLSIAAGHSMVLISERLRGTTEGRAVAAIGLLALAHSLSLTSNYKASAFYRHWMLELRALRPLLSQDSTKAVLIAPDIYRERLPASFYMCGTTIEFGDYRNHATRDALLERISNDSESMLYVPRDSATQEILVDAYSVGGYESLYVSDATLGGFIDKESRDQYEVVALTSAPTATRYWLESFGITTKGALVGWIITRAD